MALKRNRKSPFNHKVVIFHFQLMRISMNIHPKVENYKQLFGFGDGFSSARDNNLF